MSERRGRFGIIVTVLWLLLWVVVWARGTGTDNLDLNQWGDFLSGVVAPLAFLWLILGYVQQGEELKLNTQALERQERELARTAQETAELVKQTVRTAEAMEASARASATQAEQARALARPALSIQHRSAGPRHIRAGVRNRGAPARQISLRLPDKVTGSIEPTYVGRGASGDLALVVSDEVPMPITFSILGLSEVGEAFEIDVRFAGGFEVEIVRSEPPGVGGIDE